MAGTFEGLIEREEEEAVLQAALDSAQQGIGSVLILEGAAGEGKTRLFAATCAAAREAGLRVLSASRTCLPPASTSTIAAAVSVWWSRAGLQQGVVAVQVGLGR